MESKIRRVYLDCEFTGLHKDTTLISISLVGDDNKCFYAEFDDYDDSQVDDYIEEEILSKLVMTHINFEHTSKIDNVTYVKGNVHYIKNELDKWLSRYSSDIIEVWSDCLAYDWVLFINLYGDAFSIPVNIFYIPFDISTLMKAYGIDPDIKREDFIKSEDLMMNTDNKHNSLHDAIVIKACHEKLIKLSKKIVNI
jgi:hypothetical protein